jgi:hypothetical protein
MSKRWADASGCPACGESHGPPPSTVTDCDHWWACLIHEKMRNYDVARRRHESDPSACPDDLAALPLFHAPERKAEDNADVAGDDAGSAEEDNDHLENDADEFCAIVADRKKRTNDRASGMPTVVRCGILPDDTFLGSFHYPPSKIHPRAAEENYRREFGECISTAFNRKDFVSGPHLAVDTSYHLSSRDAVDAAKRQKVYFEAVDKYMFDVDHFRSAPSREADTLDRRIGDAKRKMVQAYGERQSGTVVVEAAFFLLQEGLLNIPDLGVINVKQARAFLWNAAWLQEYMNQRWRQEAELAPGTVVEDGRAELFKCFQLVIIGPGGTGKTAVLKVTEALTVFFAGEETVQKLAPSNAAARLLGGDTLHALCKLPFGQHTLTSKKGRLQNHKLQNLRKKWNRVIAAYIDEISMVPANQFLQCDTRIRQAKRNCEDLFGGLCINVCGDHLQLPPVDKDGTRKSLAKPLDDVGEEVEEILAGTEQKKGYKTEALAEGRQGFELWRRFRLVVSLSVNVRAPDALGRLQAEMRAGTLSDAMWDLYMDRVVKPLDPRLSDPASPFVKHNVHFIVHRHKIRIMRSLENAQTESKRLRTPLYVVQACDEVVHREDESKLTNAIRTALLQMVNPGETRGLPSFLPLYRGMRLLLASKDCVRLGIMKGCPGDSAGHSLRRRRSTTRCPGGRAPLQLGVRAVQSPPAGRKYILAVTSHRAPKRFACGRRQTRPFSNAPQL